MFDLTGELVTSMLPLIDWPQAFVFPNPPSTPPIFPGIPSSPANISDSTLVEGSPGSGAPANNDSFLEKFFTGPPMAGLFAVAAAGIAYLGIRRTIEHNKAVAKDVRVDHKEALNRADSRHFKDLQLTKKELEDTQARHAADLEAANRRQAEEAARANRKAESDRWWSTLTWAYEKAQESQEADAPSASTNDGFRKVAVVAILRSLSSEEQQLDRLQKDAVESIASIFSDAEEPAVRASVAQLYESIGKPSPYLERELYADRLGDALKDLPLIKRKFRDVRTPDGRHLHDWALETTDGSIIIIECAKDARGAHMLPALARTVGRAWAGIDVVPGPLRGATVSKVMLIYGGTQVHDLERLSDIQRTRIEAAIDKELGVVHWDPDAGAADLVAKLTAFLTN